MKVLITGDLGFVGTATKGLFDKKEIGYRGFDIMDAEDIRDLDFLRNFLRRFMVANKPGRILHLAAVARFSDADKDPILTHETNVLGTQNVVQAAKEFSIPLVYASTGSVYMPITEDPPITEDFPIRGNSVYGCSKALGELYVRQHTPHIILRYAHIYGREKRGHGLVGGFMDRIDRGLEPILYGGKQSNDFTYIEDVAEANYLALTTSWDNWNNAYNIGTGEEITAEEAGELVCKLAGYEGKIQRRIGRTVDPQRFVFDISKAEKMLGYKPKFTFEKGLKEMFKGGEIVG